MNTPTFPDSHEAAGHDDAHVVKTEYKFSHVTTQRYLPTPGKAPGWPFADIGSWMIDANASAADWLTELKDWRREHLVRIGYTDVNYRRPELQWAQRNFVHAQVMVEDRYLYDPVAGRYTVDRYLDDLEARFGGLDSVLLWCVYPNIGVDDRNQFDLARSLPGGLEGLRGAIADFHRRGVRVFLTTMPWDNGTRDEGEPDWQAIAKIVKAVGADGINGDTYNGVPRAFFDACDALGHPVVVQPESTISAEEHLIWNVQSWGKKAPNEVVPPVAKFKWLEPRHMINYENRWGRDRNHDLQYIFFNGVGYNASTQPDMAYGVRVTADFGRKERRSDALRGLGDVDPRPELGAFFNFSPTRGVTLNSSVRYGSGNERKGLLVDLGAGWSTSLNPHLRFGTTLATTWSNTDYAQAYFGIDAVQAARSGHARFVPGSGFRDVRLGASLIYRVAPAWSLAGSITCSELLGDARRSPIVRDKSALTAVVALGYSF